MFNGAAFFSFYYKSLSSLLQSTTSIEWNALRVFLSLESITTMISIACALSLKELRCLNISQGWVFENDMPSREKMRIRKKIKVNKRHHSAGLLPSWFFNCLCYISFIFRYMIIHFLFHFLIPFFPKVGVNNLSINICSLYNLCKKCSSKFLTIIISPL
jgi:hypothetical protein